MHPQKKAAAKPKQDPQPNPNEKMVVALELGSSRAKIGIAGFDPDDPEKRLTVYNTAELPTVDSIRYGRVNNIREVTDIVKALLETIEKKYPVDNRTILSAYISIGGRSLKAIKTKARLDLPKRSEITEKHIIELSDKAIENIQTSDEIICVEPVRYTVENMPTPRPVGSLGSNIAAEFTAVVCNPANKKDIIDAVAERAGLNISGISIRPIALAHLVLSRQEINAGCMLVDIGAETITVSIYHKYALQYLVTIPIGSRLITRDLASVLALTEEQAERIKLKMADALPDNTRSGNDDAELRETVNAVVQARVADIVANIAAQPKFAGISPDRLPAGIILAGGGANMPNLPLLLKAHTGLKVRIATLPSDVIIYNADLAAADNLDIIALLSESANSARAGNDCECLSAPLPVEIPQPEPEEKPTVQTPKSNHADVVVDLTPSTTERTPKNPEPANSANDPTDEDSDPFGYGGFGYEPGDFEPQPQERDTYTTPHRPSYVEPDDEPGNPWDEEDDFEDPKEKRRRRTEEKKRKRNDENIMTDVGKGKNKKNPDDDSGETNKKPVSRIEKIISRLTDMLNGQGEDESIDLE